jgi:hypothetical protein
MKITLGNGRPKANLRGGVCTVHLRLLAQSVCATAPSSRTLSPKLCSTIELQLRQYVSASLGTEFDVSEIIFLEDGAEILLKISTLGYFVKTYDTFAKALTSLVSSCRSAIEWACRAETDRLKISGEWYPEPQLVSLELAASDELGSFSKRLQQPLTLLLIGTLLGSVLIPFVNDISNQRKVRHEERIKIALTIVEQSHETDRRLSNLINYLVLFRKDHDDPSASRAFIKAEQSSARKTFNEMYISFNAQAWWWHWTVKSESSLSALATQPESKRISELARQYSDSLEECSHAVTSLWDPFLKNAYNPADPKNDQLIAEASDNLTKARKRRNEIALEMARVFALH